MVRAVASRGDRCRAPGTEVRPYSTRTSSCSGRPRSPRWGDSGAKKAVRSPRAWAGTDWSWTTCSSAPSPTKPSASSRSRVRASAAVSASRRCARVAGGAHGSCVSAIQPTAELAPPANAVRLAERASAPSARIALLRRTTAGSSGSDQVAAAGSVPLAKWCSSRVRGAVSKTTPSWIQPSAVISHASPSTQRAWVEAGALGPGHAPGPPSGALPEASWARRMATRRARSVASSRSSGCRRTAVNNPRVSPLWSIHRRCIWERTTASRVIAAWVVEGSHA